MVIWIVSQLQNRVLAQENETFNKNNRPTCCGLHDNLVEVDGDGWVDEDAALALLTELNTAL